MSSLEAFLTFQKIKKTSSNTSSSVNKSTPKNNIIPKDTYIKQANTYLYFIFRK